MLGTKVITSRLAIRLKWLVFPGMNLHARLRYRFMPRYFGRSDSAHPRWVLDAGCGNGMLSYQSFRRGNCVVAVSNDQAAIERAKQLFYRFLGVAEERLCFRLLNLYNLESLDVTFDEIICTEVLEHIVRDVDVCRCFWRLLRPGGTLHLCCPNADHPDNREQQLDKHEQGGHVRTGYTIETYRALLAPIGFTLSPPVPLGGPIRQTFDKRIIRALDRGKFTAAALLFLLGMPLQLFDPPLPRVPLSLYVRAFKPQ